MSSLVESFVPLSDMMDTMRSETFESIQSEKDLMPEASVKHPDPHAEGVTAHSEPLDSTKKPTANDSVQSISPESARPHNLESCQEPRVLIDKEGARITKIRVLCSCGQSVVVDCRYDDSIATEPAIEDRSE
ncbi:MAG: hypothetical protein ACO3VS_02465 [Limisphaerales bacterium]